MSVSRGGFPLLPAPFPALPFPIVVPITQITPPPVTASPSMQTCICVPIGTCTGTTVAPTPTDGLIDIRIVNNVCCIHYYRKLLRKNLIIVFLCSQVQRYHHHHVLLVFSAVAIPGHINVAYVFHPWPTVHHLQRVKLHTVNIHGKRFYLVWAMFIKVLAF